MELRPQDWEKVRAIARNLAVDVDRNELGKVISFFRLRRNKERFLELIERLSRSEEMIRSQRTRGYFLRILAVCREELADVDSNQRALLIVSWAFRLMTYYEEKSGEMPGRQRRW